MYLEALNTIDWKKAPHLLISGVAEWEREGIVSALLATLESSEGQSELYKVTLDNFDVTLADLQSMLESRNLGLAMSFSKNIDHFNRMASDEGLAHVLCVIEEIADFEGNKEFYNSVMKLAAHGRAVGIHVAVLTSDTAPGVRTIPGRVRTNLLRHIELGVVKPVAERVKTEVMFLSMRLNDRDDVQANEKKIALALDDGFDVSAMSNDCNGMTTVMLVKPGGWQTVEGNKILGYDPALDAR